MTEKYSDRLKNLLTRDFNTTWTNDIIAMFNYAATLGSIVFLLFLDIAMPPGTFLSLLVALVVMNGLASFYLCQHSRFLAIPLFFSLLSPFIIARSELSHFVIFIIFISFAVVISIKLFYITFLILFLSIPAFFSEIFGASNMLTFYVFYGGFFILISSIIFPWTTRHWNYLFPKPRTRLLSREERQTIGERGLTLIELLITIAIISIVAAGSIKVMTHHRVSSDYLSNVNQASMLAVSQMEALVAGDELPEGPEEKYQLPVDPETLNYPKHFHGHLTLSANYEKDLALVTVHIQWRDRSGEHEYRLDRLFERI